jgi:UPF0755 protein
MKYFKQSSAVLLSLSFFLLVVLFCTFLVINWVRFLITPIVPPDKSFDYILPAGGSVRVLSHDLTELGLLKYPRYFQLLAYLKGYANHLRAGEFHFDVGITPGELLKQIAEGKVLWRKVTFVEGSTFNQIREQLESNPLIVHDLAGYPSIVVMMKLDLLHTNLRPEGLFFPDTYIYTAGMSEKDILSRAHHLMEKKLSEEWENRANNLPYQNVYKALIAASIIEKEARLESERIQISGVIKRRLEKGMLLQMDPTVIYAVEDAGEDFHPPIRREDLRVDSLYNTYLYKGLPPTPICLPSLSSIHAALHPAGGDALYFVAKGNGTHQFSATYSAHLNAIRTYEGR